MKKYTIIKYIVKVINLKVTKMEDSKESRNQNNAEELKNIEELKNLFRDFKKYIEDVGSKIIEADEKKCQIQLKMLKGILSTKEIELDSLIKISKIQKEIKNMENDVNNHMFNNNTSINNIRLEAICKLFSMGGEDIEFEIPYSTYSSNIKSLEKGDHDSNYNDTIKINRYLIEKDTQDILKKNKINNLNNNIEESIKSQEKCEKKHQEIEEINKQMNEFSKDIKLNEENTKNFMKDILSLIDNKIKSPKHFEEEEIKKIQIFFDIIGDSTIINVFIEKANEHFKELIEKKRKKCNNANQEPCSQQHKQQKQ